MKSCSIIAASLVLAASANASVIVYDFNNSFQTTEIRQTGNLSLFDSSLGTLTGASITVNGTATMNLSATNIGAVSNSANLISSVDLSWGSTLSALSPFLTDVISLSAASGTQSYSVFETKSFGPLSSSGSRFDDLATVLGSLQAPGGGSFGVTCNSLSGLTLISGGGSFGTSQSSQAQCGASIVYTYNGARVTANDVPEPGSLVLVVLALAGVGFAGRHRKS
jgi:hypothetical protein